MTENATEKLPPSALVKIKPSVGEVLKTQLDLEGDLFIHADQHGMVDYGRGSVWLGSESMGEFVAALDQFGVLKRFGYEKPKPPLPTGLGAVVRDKETSERYVLAEEKSAFVAAGGYLRWQRGGRGGTWWSDRDIASFDYEILSEGVAA